MPKSGPISKVEAFYIDNHYKTMSPEELADTLDRKITTVKSYIKNNITPSQIKIKAGEHFVKNKGTIVMTETASMLSDAQKKTPKKTPACVTKIKHE
jgi:hypothetical protein